jgi:flavin-dependent dehydrogenase
MSAERFQLTIVGSGFAGSIVALIARRLGLSVEGRTDDPAQQR